MSWADFEVDPWRKSHPVYADSFISVKPAPEYASGEVLVSSLYRRIGFETIAERDVPSEGRAFEKAMRKPAQSKGSVSDETWRTVVNKVLESPKLPNQASKPFLQLSPVVPDVGLYSGSARRSGNSWPAGKLVEALVVCGEESRQSAERTWAELFDGLSVADSDDVWARWLQTEFGKRQVHSEHTWGLSAIEMPSVVGLESIHLPARHFVRDLKAVLAAKRSLTRAQWISLLGAVIRLGGAMHVLWLCDVHDRLWRYLRLCILEGTSDNAPGFLAQVFPSQFEYLAYGKPAVPVVRDLASKYLTARLGINAILWHMKDPPTKLDSPLALHRLGVDIANQRTLLGDAGFLTKLAQLQEKEARTLGCKKGIGSNMVEFGRHVLGQRQSATEVLRGYDQAYFLRKKGSHAAAPWIVSLGPAAVISLVHCCMYRAGGPRSVHRLAEHLGAYGLRVDIEDLLFGELGSKLRLLGLVLDSPDAETGMLLMPPFRQEAEEAQQ